MGNAYHQAGFFQSGRVDGVVEKRPIWKELEIAQGRERRKSSTIQPFIRIVKMANCLNRHVVVYEVMESERKDRYLDESRLFS